jgi:hypothetical protein
MFTMTGMAGEITPYRAESRTVKCRRASALLLLGLLRLCDLVLLRGLTRHYYFCPDTPSSRHHEFSIRNRTKCPLTRATTVAARRKSQHQQKPINDSRACSQDTAQQQPSPQTTQSQRTTRTTSSLSPQTTTPNVSKDTAPARLSSPPQQELTPAQCTPTQPPKSQPRAPRLCQTTLAPCTLSRSTS